MKVNSTRFGNLDVVEEQVYKFPHGIPGFPDERNFVFIQHNEESPFSFLQSITEANLTFLLADPYFFLQDYEFVLEDEVAKELNLSPENPPGVYLIASVKEKLADMTVNLLAPIVMNKLNHTARQVILDKPEYSIRYKLFPGGLPKEAVEGGW